MMTKALANPKYRIDTTRGGSTVAAMRTKDLDRVIESVRLRAMWSGLIVGVTIGGSVVALVMGMGI